MIWLWVTIGVLLVVIALLILVINSIGAALNGILKGLWR